MMDNIAELAKALVKAQSELTAVPRNKTVKVRTRDGREYSFSYATLDAVIEHVRKPLTDNGLWFVQTLESNIGPTVLVTRLFHTSGQFITGDVPVPMPEGQTPQELGSLLTYLKRYALGAILGIATEEDDDGNSASGNAIVEARMKPASAAESAIGKRAALVAGAGTNEATQAAMNFAIHSINKIHDFATLDDFDAWHTPSCRNKIASVKKYDEQLHKQLLETIDKFVMEHQHERQ